MVGRFLTSHHSMGVSMPKSTPKNSAKTGQPKGLAATPLKPNSSDNQTQPPTGQPLGLNAPSLPGGGQSIQEIIRRSNYWRDNYNPLLGLTLSRLKAIFEFAERGAFAELQLTLRKAEKRFPILKGFVEKLLSCIEELPWDVKIKKQLPAGANQDMAEKQQQFLRARYDLLKNFTASIAQLALADVRGYAVLQKHRYDGGENDGAVQELYWIEPWCWARDGYYGDFYYNEISRFGVGLGSCAAVFGENNRIGSDAMPRGEFVIREVDSPIYEIGLIAMINWLMARKDWAAFVEIFGLPNGVVIISKPKPCWLYWQRAGITRSTVCRRLPTVSAALCPTARILNSRHRRFEVRTRLKNIVTRFRKDLSPGGVHWRRVDHDQQANRHRQRCER